MFFAQVGRWELGFAGGQSSSSNRWSFLGAPHRPTSGAVTPMNESLSRGDTDLHLHVREQQ